MEKKKGGAVKFETAKTFKRENRDRAGGLEEGAEGRLERMKGAGVHDSAFLQEWGLGFRASR